ncbi:unnamed protein product [Malus baccata var. baccata]
MIHPLASSHIKLTVKGLPQLVTEQGHGMEFDLVYYKFEANKNVVAPQLRIYQSSSLQRLVLNAGSAKWDVMISLPDDPCDSYGYCGANAICRNRYPICVCLQGFTPRFQEEWEMFNRTKGFLLLEGVKLPGMLEFSLNESMNLEECMICLKNCFLRYLGIWYKNFPDTVVWVANREKPLADSNGSLTLSKNGSLILLDNMNNTLWSSNSSRAAEDPVAQLLETGNLVVRDKAATDSEDYVWQSFDFPTDTLLPEMKLGWNFGTGLNRFLTSWKNASDPSPGEYTYGMDRVLLPQLVISEGSKKKFRTGPWNGIRITGTPFPALSYGGVVRPYFVYNSNELYYAYEAVSNSTITRLKLTELGEIQRLLVNNGSTAWAVMYTLRNDECSNYGQCGANGFCKINKSPICDCLPGFFPTSTSEWGVLNWTRGCRRETQLNCSKGFLKIENVKLPDQLDFWVKNSTSNSECKAECLKNCSCVAYANSDIKKESSLCLMWFGDLIDLREFIEEDGDQEQDIYIRGPWKTSGKNDKKVVLISVISAVCLLLFLGLALFSWCIILKRRRNKRASSDSEENLELPLFDFDTIAAATNHFSHTNKLGEGGFGSVYKAWLLWNKGKCSELIDQCLEYSYVEFEVQRCIQVGLLCVQKLPVDRPAMSSVVFMLGNEGAPLPQPKEPGFFTERSSEDIDTLVYEGRSQSGSSITITTVVAR